MGEFRMPSLGADMEAGTLVEWLVKPGDTVKHGDIIAVVETQKGAIEIEVFEDGVFETSLVEIGDTVPVGTPLAIINGAGAEPSKAPAAAPPIVPTPETPVVPERPVIAERPHAEQGGAGRQRISPAARRLAAREKIDTAALAGSGPDGAIVLNDVERAAAGRLAAKPPEKAQPAGSVNLEAMRTAIAAAMARSKREIPHYYLRDTVDVTNAQAWLADANAERPRRNGCFWPLSS
ncbi:biotin/lipoyl-containing protein [Breoghania sp. L-A4]|uniref:biotin/lipoyl-containing protein n=1 Tax=Breoghania sp. L-A4 TaxID=2304600 RepID=UPI0019672E11|nr:biotin/lipoyl-containing protein [Breoghania sp. L-A4]